MVADHYEILGLDHRATAQDIRAAYRRKAQEFHPDINKERDATEKMVLVNKAYAVLSDPVLKQQYDRVRARSGQSSQTSRSSPPTASPPSEQKPSAAAAMNARVADQVRATERARSAEKARTVERARSAEKVRAAEGAREAEKAWAAERRSQGEQAQAQDYYAVLGLNPNASSEAIQAAYRRSAEYWRTNRHNTSGAAGVPAVVTRAYALLSNPVLRRNYDRTRTRTGQPPQPATAGQSEGRPPHRALRPSGGSTGPAAGPTPPPARALFTERYSFSEAQGMASYLTKLDRYVGGNRTSLDRVTRDNKDGAIIEGWMTQRLGTPEGKWLGAARDAMKRNDLSRTAAALKALSNPEESTPRQPPRP